MLLICPRVQLSAGWPRQRMNSVAEAELLMQLAALLTPKDAPIEEMFRNFPAPEGWGGHYLEPDLSLYGVLKDEDAALFVEYDGYWRHEGKEGMERDRTKNAALLTYAPARSSVIRISHTTSRPLEGNALWIKINTWRRGDRKSLSKILMDLLIQLQSSDLGGLLHPSVANRVSVQTERGNIKLSSQAQELARSAALVGAGNTSNEISIFLSSEGFGLHESALMQQGLSPGISIERTLQPIVQWLLDLGLSKSQVAKAVATKPQILGYSIQQNLNPTAQWFLDLRLTKSRVAKAVATYPQILGLSIEENLKPTLQWFLDLGMTTSQVAKAVATHPPILWLSIKQNLQPTVQWFLELGMTKRQVAKGVATHPQILCYSIEQNLKPTVQWFLDLGMTTSQVAKAVATFPQVLSLSIEGNLKPTLQWFLDLGMTMSQVAKAVATFPVILGLSIEQNLVPTVQWFLDLGVTKSQVAKAVATYPQILGYSIQQNLNPTVEWLQKVGLSRKRLGELIVSRPRLLGCSLAGNLQPKGQLMERFCSQKGARVIISSNPEILRFSMLQLQSTCISIENPIRAEQDIESILCDGIDRRQLQATFFVLTCDPRATAQRQNVEKTSHKQFIVGLRPQTPFPETCCIEIDIIFCWFAFVYLHRKVMPQAPVVIAMENPPFVDVPQSKDEMSSKVQYQSIRTSKLKLLDLIHLIG